VRRDWPVAPEAPLSERSLSRRGFLAVTGASIGALTLGRAAESPNSDRDSLSRIGLQLYTVRGEMQHSVESTLVRVAQIGYKEVEFAGYFGKTPREIRALLDDNGLVSPSSHSADFQTMRTRWPQALEDARIIGQRYIVCASIPRQESRTTDDYRKVAAFLNQRGEEARKVGITLGYHNHDAEFQALGSGSGYDVLIAECEPKLVRMQLDLYWMVKGGKDPLEYFAKYRRHYFSVHVKDMSPTGDMADVGAGQLPFARYFVAGKKAGVRYYFVEHDQPGDPWASVTASYRYLRTLKF
jgi:sugar phosphate isomerase/epimerase